MRDTNTILGLIHERGKQGLPLERVQRLLYNQNVYLTAYGKIYRNKGAMTKGVTEETVEGMSLDKIEMQGRLNSGVQGLLLQSSNQHGYML